MFNVDSNSSLLLLSVNRLLLLCHTWRLELLSFLVSRLFTTMATTTTTSGSFFWGGDPSSGLGLELAGMLSPVRCR